MFFYSTKCQHVLLKPRLRDKNRVYGDAVNSLIDGRCITHAHHSHFGFARERNQALQF